MARFEVFHLKSAGLVVDVQARILDHLPTRIVIPLEPADGSQIKIDRLHPSLEIDGRPFVLLTHLIAPVPASILKEAAFDISKERDPITAALDMLFFGF